jgi:hypothetical protein
LINETKKYQLIIISSLTGWHLKLLPSREKVVIISFAIFGQRELQQSVSKEDKKNKKQIFTQPKNFVFVELAELQPPMFDLHPMRALFLMSKSGFKPPTLKEKERWSPIFHSFVKISLTKNPKKRPNAERLLAHPFVNGGGAGTGEMTVRLMRELLHKYSNPHQFNDGSEMDEDGAIGHSVPKRIPSKMGTVQRALHLGEGSKKMIPTSNNNNSEQLSPPETLPSEMSLANYMDEQWRQLTLSSSGNKNNHQRGCIKHDESPQPSTSAMAASEESSPKRHNSMDRLVGMFSDLSKASIQDRQRSLSDGEQQPDLLNNTPPVPPKRKHRNRSPPPLHHPVSNGLPPTPKVSEKKVERKGQSNKF